MKVKKISAAILASGILFTLGFSTPTAIAQEIKPEFQQCTPLTSANQLHPFSLEISSHPGNDIQCGRSIPSSLLLSARVVNLSKFTARFEGGKLRDPKTGWHIERDFAGHGGSYWKLKSPHSNPTIYSIRRDGSIR